MPIARVTNNTWVDASALSGSGPFGGDGVGQRVQVALTDAVQSGSLLVAVTEVLLGVDETITFGDDKGNTWQQLVGRFYSSAGAKLAIGYAMNCAAGSTTVYARSDSNVNRFLAVSEYTGAATTGAADGSNSANGTGSAATINPGAVTTTAAGIIISACVYTDGGEDVTALNGDYTLTKRTMSGGYPVFVQDWITSGSQSSHAASFTGNKSFWNAAVVAFKAAAGGSSTPIAALAHHYAMLRAAG
jgi:hypothetical protein